MAALRYIANEDKMARLLKNLRLQNFESPCDILKVVLRDIPNEDQTAGLFKNLRLEVFASPCDISKVVLRYIPDEDMAAGLFNNLRLKILQVHVICHGQSSDISPMKTRQPGSLRT